VITQLAVAYLGRAGIDTLAAIMGVSDVDPFIMGLTQTAGRSMASIPIAAGAILIAAASNNLIKGIYAFGLSERTTGRQSLIFLVLLTIAGLAPLFILPR